MRKIQWKRRCGSTLLAMLITMVIGFVIGLLIMTGISTGSTEQALPLGMFFACGMGMFVHAIGSALCLPVEFNLAVSMGETRAKFLRGYTVASAIELMFLWAATGIFFGIEKGIYRVLRKAPMPELPFDSGVLWAVLFLTVLGLLAADLFFGALFLRFGMKTFWAGWALCMLSPYLVRQIAKMGDFFGTWGIGQSIALACLFFVMFLSGWAMMKRQSVTM